jgi:hypothetical protein
MARNIIRMKIKVDHIEPEIWRRFLVYDTVTLHGFHKIIQTVMEWTDSHLYLFFFRGDTFSQDDGDFDAASIDSRSITLRGLHLSPRRKIHYTYDLGDNWEHTITVEKFFYDAPGGMAPLLLDGARNCPPEDCGSVPGYENIINALKNPQSAESRDLLDHYGDFAPESFDLQTIDDRLEQFRKQTVKRRKSRK